MFQGIRHTGSPRGRGEASVPVDKELLDIFICPSCGGDVEYRQDEEVIVCLKCGLRYPVKDDIPVMLIGEAQRPASARGRPTRSAIRRSLRRPARPPCWLWRPTSGTSSAPYSPPLDPFRIRPRATACVRWSCAGW